MAQLPRCVQLASWKQVCGRVGGARSCSGLSIQGMYFLAGRKAAAASAAAAAGGLLRARAARPRFQNPLARIRPGSGPAFAIGGGDDRLGFYASTVVGFSTDCSRVLGKNGARILSPAFARHVSSAEVSAIADGVSKESLVKDSAEASGLGGDVSEGNVVDEVKGSAGVSTEVLKEEDGGEPGTELGFETGGEKASVVSFAEANVGFEGETNLSAEADVTSVEASEVFLDLGEERERGNADRDALFAEIQSKELEQQSRELELEELRKELRVIDRRQSLVAELQDGDSLSLAKSVVTEEEVLVGVDGAADVSSGVSAVENPQDEFGGMSALSESDSDLDGSLTSESESEDHPWPVWTQFLSRLRESGHFDVNEDEVDPYGPPMDDVGMIKRACLSFARERDDIFLNLPRKDLEVIARFGCPSTDRKVVNAGKRLRDFLAIDEVSVCRPCALRASCERRDHKASASHIAGTPEVARLLSQYALEVSSKAKEGLRIPSLVQQSCENLLNKALALGAIPRDPKLPKPDRPAPSESAKKSPPRFKESNKRSFKETEDVELKKGDWRCEECQYVNFARNRKCRECDSFRPVPEMRPGDWRCSSCQFVNFSRNEACYDCKAPRPAGAGFESSFDKGSRYQRGAPQERGSRYDRGSSRDRRSDSWDGDRAPYRRSESSNYGRSSSRDSDRDMDRSQRRGDRQREPMSKVSRDRGVSESRFGSDGPRSVGGRTKHEEWKPDFNRTSDNEGKKDWRSAKISEFDDEDADDDVDMSDDEGFTDDVGDVEGFGDEEFEDMRPAARNSRGRGSSNGGRLGRSEDKDVWWEDDSISRRGSSRGGRGRPRDSPPGRGREGSQSRDSPSSRGRGGSDREYGRSSYGRSSGGGGGRGGRDSRGGRGARGGRGGRGGGGRGR